MRNKIILLTFVLFMSFGNVFADIAPMDKPNEKETKQGVCFLPVVIGGTLFSLSLVVLGLRIIRKQENRGKQQETTE